MKKHLESDLHSRCVTAWNQRKLSHSEVLTETLLGKHIYKENEALANRIGGLMIEVYNTVKRGTVSAQAWPSTHMAQVMGSEFSINKSHTPYQPEASQFQYLNPVQHADLMRYIVNADKPTLTERIRNSLAACISVDGAVDRFQLDNKHVKCKLISAAGVAEDLFLGFDSTTERGAGGYVNAVKSAVEWCIPWMELLRKASCIVTDGENMNIGRHHSLWALLDEERRSIGLSPLLKLWCGAHRADLAFSNVSDSVEEVSFVITDATALSTYFHCSSVRTRELHEVAVKEGLPVRRLPQYFEVRFCEFTYRLLSCILSSWRCIICYLTTSADTAAAGHLRNWTDINKLKTACFLADVLLVYSRFQKSLQDNNFTLFDLAARVELIKSQLMAMRDTPLLGGWESTFIGGLSEENTFHGVKLHCRGRRTKGHHSCVSDRRDYGAVRREIVFSLENFIQERFESDEKIVADLTPLLMLSANVSDEALKACHNLITPDVDLASFALQYREAAVCHNMQSLKTPQLILQDLLAKGVAMPELTTALARAVVSKPHSADVERLIRSYNVVKTADRANLTSHTLRHFLYIRHNMPVVSHFDPRPAVHMWMKDKARRNVEPQKGPLQQWFSSMFPEAQEKSEKSSHSLNDKITF